MEERVLAKKSDLVAVAEAIRSRTGDTEELSLEEMPALIAGIGDGVSPVYQTIAEALVMDKNLFTNNHLDIFKNATKLSNYAFADCDSITEANFPNLTQIQSYCFYNCSKLETANFPNVESMGTQAFYNCSKLTNIIFPKLQTTSSQCFGSCSALASAIFPLLKTIAGYCFSYDRALSTVILDYNGEGAIKNTYAFRDCSSLTTLVLRSEQLWTLDNINSFTGTPIASGTGYIYVPSALIDTYKTANNWSTYAAQFRALEDYTVDGTITGDLDETKISTITEE